MNWIEITLAVLGGLNLYMQLTVKNQMLELKLDITEKFLSKKDFKDWTARSNYLPSFGKEKE